MSAANLIVAACHSPSERELADMLVSADPDVRDAAQVVLAGLAGTLIEHRASMEACS